MLIVGKDRNNIYICHAFALKECQIDKPFAVLYSIITVR